ncbi:MAG: low molecular weight protein-tyrosine-phosphatase [Desulfobacteraceae bacterium]|jgi:protein-tyrosine phosphatase
MFKVLMVCTGNICRSPMAAGLLNHYLPVDLKSRVEVSSAGTHALHGHHAESHALKAMDRIGIDIHHHRARQVTSAIARESDLILTMEAAHVRKVNGLLVWKHKKPIMISEFNMQTPAHDIADPYGGPFSAYEDCIHTLCPCIKGVILWLGTNL